MAEYFPWPAAILDQPSIAKFKDELDRFYLLYLLASLLCLTVALGIQCYVFFVFVWSYYMVTAFAD